MLDLGMKALGRRCSMRGASLPDLHTSDRVCKTLSLCTLWPLLTAVLSLCQSYCRDPCGAVTGVD